MADAVIQFDTKDIFGLTSSNFNAGDASLTDAKEEKMALDARGDIACADATGDIQEWSQSFTYCGDDFASDIGDYLAEFGLAVNGDEGDQLITAITLTMNSADYATVEITGHNHTSNAHEIDAFNRVADFSGLLPASWNGFGIVDILGASTPATATPSSLSYSFTFETHADTDKPDGTHFSGQSSTPKCDISAEYSGSIAGVDVETTLNAAYTPLVFNVTDSPVAYAQTEAETSGFSAFTYAASASQTVTP